MIDDSATTRPDTSAAQPAPGSATSLVRSALAPIICSVLLLGLLSAWVVSGGDGTISRVRIDITAASIAAPARAGTPAFMYLTVVNLSAADRLVSVTTPTARLVEFVQHHGTAQGPGQRLTSIPIPAGATVNLSPFTMDILLVDPAHMAVGSTVPITLAFGSAGRVTVQAAVNPPGTP
jgi:copper(I)-binding protein